MWWWARPLAAALALWALAACTGYRFAADAPLALPGQYRTLAIKNVEVPTMDFWLGARLRSLLRDEFTRRGLLHWADADKADALVNVRVVRYVNTAGLRNVDEETVRYSAELVLEARVVSAADNAPIWESGQVTARESYYGQDERDAGEKAALLAVREVADRLGHGF